MQYEVVDYDSWCRRLPRWWMEACGCHHKCSNLDVLRDKMRVVSAEAAEMVGREDFVVLEGWAVKRVDSHTVALYPWPKHLVRRWW